MALILQCNPVKMAEVSNAFSHMILDMFMRAHRVHYSILSPDMFERFPNCELQNSSQYVNTRMWWCSFCN